MKSTGKDSLTVLGIDPGSLSCGYGIIISESGNPRYVSSGRIVLKGPLHERLRDLFAGLDEVIRDYKPSHAAVEKVFFAKGVKAALSLGQARGVALLAAASAGLSVHEYGALEVKKAVTGYGRAEKRQVQEMIKSALGIKAHLSADGADALAIAYCHINHLALGARIRGVSR